MTLIEKSSLVEYSVTNQETLLKNIYLGLDGGNYGEVYDLLTKITYQTDEIQILTAILAPKHRLLALTEGMSLSIFQDKLPIKISPFILNENLIKLQRNKTIEIENGRIYLLGPISQHSDSYTDFIQKFQLSSLTTEQSNPLTKNLSQTMHNNVEEGISLLHAVDQQIIEGLNAFLKENASRLTQDLKKCIQEGGRIFLVGSGSSGRIALDLAAKWNEECKRTVPENQDRVYGVIAGGERAFVKAKEGFEDSEEEGKKALLPFNLVPKDRIILISASGSSSFNAGCGKYAYDNHIPSYYFLNSEYVPERTKELFEKFNVIPLKTIINPPPIAGSTRLQAASLAEVCLGGCLAAVIQNIDEGIIFSKLLDELKLIDKQLASKLGQIAEMAYAQFTILNDPNANFRRLVDAEGPPRGCITYLSRPECIRVIMTDTTEIPPTFSTNPPKSIDDFSRKRAEFRGYLIGSYDDSSAWEQLIGRNLPLNNLTEALAFVLSANENIKLGAFSTREGEGNFVIGVADLTYNDDMIDLLIQSLEKTLENKSRIGLILLTKKQQKTSDQLKSLMKKSDNLLILELPEKDVFGIGRTIMLKQVLNYLSNTSMILMNKVYKNLMIDVSASNNKLIDRAIRICQELGIYGNSSMKLNYKTLYHYLLHCLEQKKIWLEEKNQYTPSIVKIVMTMIHHGINFEKAVILLHDHHENLEKILQL